MLKFGNVVLTSLKLVCVTKSEGCVGFLVLAEWGKTMFLNPGSQMSNCLHCNGL